ncbi:MAG: hypothetical protein ACPGVV_10225 [Croceimicrobium sp.]
MKKLWMLGLLALFACQSNSESEDSSTAKAKEYPQYEQSELELNGKRVYAVIVRDSSDERESRGYKVAFKMQDRVWYDTLVLELSGKRMVQGEVIFSDAVINDAAEANFEVESFEIK